MWHSGQWRRRETSDSRAVTRGARTGLHVWQPRWPEHAPPRPGRTRAVSLAPPPGVGLPAAEDAACKPRRAETATQSPRGVWPPGRLSLGPAARPPCPVGSRPLPPRILADNRPADKRVSSRKISGAAVTTEESRGPSAVTPLTGGHLGFGASQRRPRSHRQQGGTDGSLGVRDELPGLPVTGAILRGGKALTVSGTVASRARGAGRGGAPGVSSTHTPGVAPPLSPEEGFA